MTTKSEVTDTQDALKFAIRSIQRADLEIGKATLRWVLRRDPSNETAREWLKRCDEYPQAEDLCLV